MKNINKSELVLHFKEVISVLKKRYDKILVNAGAFPELKIIREQIRETEQKLQIVEKEISNFNSGSFLREVSLITLRAEGL